MNSKNILIAAASIILISSLLSGCGLIEKKQENEAVMPKTEVASGPKIPKKVDELVMKAAAAKKEVKLVLEAEKSDGEVKVMVKLDNPQKKPITSVQSWLSFDAEKLQGKEISTDESAFQLPAPYDSAFDNTNGLVMLGRSNPEPVTDESILVAEITFKALGKDTVMIDAYDYREDLTGHMSVNTLIEGVPYNILIQPESPALIVENQ